MLFLIIVAAILIICIEIPSLIQQKKWKDLAVFSGFLLSGMFLGILLIVHLAFPISPHGIEALFKPAAKLLLQ